MVSMHDQDNYENKECSLRKMYHLDEGAFKKITWIPSFNMSLKYNLLKSPVGK